MKLATVSFWCTPAIARRLLPLLITGLLSTTAWAGSYAYHAPHPPSVIPVHAVHDGGHDVGVSRHGGHDDGKHMKHGKGHDDMYAHDGHHGGKHMKYGRDHHDMHSHDGKHGGGYGGGYGGRHGRHEKHPGAHRGATEFIDHILKFQEGMSLTDDQVEQLHTIKTNYRKTRITMKADIKLANVDLHELLKDEQSSLADIETQLNAMHGLKAKLYLESIKAQRQAMAVLSEEQRSRMDTIHKRIKSHGGQMMHRDGSPGHRKHNGYGQE